jgi:protein associated with RNAse G/E
MFRRYGKIVDEEPEIEDLLTFFKKTFLNFIVLVRKLGSSYFHLRIEPLVTAHSSLLNMLDMQL